MYSELNQYNKILQFVQKLCKECTERPVVVQYDCMRVKTSNSVFVEMIDDHEIDKQNDSFQFRQLTILNFPFDY